MKLTAVVIWLIALVIGVQGNIVEASAAVVGNIPVGETPVGIVSTPSGDKLYVANFTSGSVSVIDTNSNLVIKTIPMTQGGQSNHLVMSPSGKEVYVSERLSGKVKVISTVTDTVEATIDTYATVLNEISVSLDGSKIYVASASVRGSIRMTIIDTATREIVGFLDTNDAQEKIIISPDGKIGYVQLLVNNSSPLNVYTQIIDLESKSVIGTIPGSMVVIVSDDGRMAWGRHNGSHTVNLIDLTTNTVVKSTTVAETPLSEVLFTDQSGSYIFVSNHYSGLVTKLDAQTLDIIETIPVSGMSPTEMVLSHDKTKLYVVSLDTNSVDIIQLDSVPDTNNAPVFNLIGDRAVNEGETLQFTVSASDPDGDVVTLSVDGAPDGALFNESTGVFSWTPSLTSSGEYTVTFTATDDGTPALSSEIDVHIVVTDVPPVVEPKDVYDLIHELIATVEGYVFPSATEQSYMANLKKVESFLNSAKYMPAENQIRSFVKKLTQDFKAGKITQVQYDDLLGRANAILEAIPDDAFGMVPRMTQVVSPYPSLAETSSWANAVYADGRADKVGDCGRTIAQCGCAITSLSMIGKSYEINTGFDGSTVNPLHMNEWLLANGGYSHDGSVLWNYALAYMGQEKNGKVMSKLSLDGYNEKNVDVIKKFIDNGNPSLGFSAAKGHYVTLTGTIDEGGYSINDPLWYNTRTTDDDRDVALKVQDYNNVISKANLIGYSAALKPLSESVEIVLESPAELLVIDEKGRRLGYDTVTNSFVSEIPGGTYDREDFIVNPENPTASPHKVKRIFITKPEGEVFDVRVIGTGEGLYHVSFAVTDGVGGLFGDSSEGTAHVGSIDGYTVTTMRGTEALPIYLQNIVKLIPLAEQKKFIQTFAVIAGQVEKDHVVSTNHIIENLIRYMEEKYRGKSWVPAVVSALRALEQ